MFVRIVKMSFHSKYIEEFSAMFHEKKEYIRASNGCKIIRIISR